MENNDTLEVIQRIPLDKLRPYPDHPFGVRDDDMMQQTVESIKQFGVLVPGIARPLPDGTFELIAGHRRKQASAIAGLDDMPIIVRDIDRNAATIIMVDSNLQRENILPSEKAKSDMISPLVFSKANTLSLFVRIQTKLIFTIISIGTPLHLIANESFVISEIQAKP